MIELCDYAKSKILILEKLGFGVTEDEIKEVVKRPSRVVFGKKGRKIAQRPVSETHLLRVIYEEHGRDKMVITFYPARRERYEKHESEL